MLSQAARDRFPRSHHVLLNRLVQIVDSLRKAADTPAPFVFTADPVEFFNSYLDFATSVYREKLLQLYEGIVEALEKERYLIYAQCGRTVLENIATLRYYSRHEDLVAASSAWRGTHLTDRILRRANETLDRFVRGNRFAWEAFIEGRMDLLTKAPHQEHLSQINAITCLQKWYKDSPNLESLYDLLCDLVHPNMGSNLMITRVLSGRLLGGGNDGQSNAIFVVAPTLAGILGAYKEFEGSTAVLNSLRLESEK